jgi:uncharacterized iron-regulated membrane protein
MALEVTQLSGLMRLKSLGRKVHHWLAPVVLLPALLIFGTGILLQLRQEVEWIQPKTRLGSEPGLPQVSWAAAFDSVKSVPEAGMSTWEQVASIDVKPSKSVMSFRSKEGFEVQVDSATGAVLHAAPRRTSFLIELHQGSYFHSKAMTFVFLPAGVGLLLISLTGLLLIRKRMFRKPND